MGSRGPYASQCLRFDPLPRSRALCLIVCLGAVPALAGGCFQKVSSSASNGRGQRDPNAIPSTVIEPSAPPIETDPDDESVTATDPCQKTRADKTDILKAYCARCHDGPTSSGLPQFDFVLDDSALLTRQWVREGQSPQRFVIPGDPEHSVLYTRVALIGDMPAQPSDVATPRNPVPSPSDVSVLYEWILDCTGPSEGRGSGSTAGPDGGGRPGSPASDAGATDPRDLGGTDTGGDKAGGGGGAEAGAGQGPGGADGGGNVRG
jgi:hypothetical protein